MKQTKDILFWDLKKLGLSLFSVYGAINMPKTVNAIYEDGVFKPLEKVNIKPHKKIDLVIFPSEEEIPNIVKFQKKNLARLSGIGKSNLGSLGRNHDKYLY